ncbi:hypothetical protein [Pseudofrankia asymbiotica]|uniref:Uncharacterized protein n=1 Tax=Pseudofrankia asymbiotica TaxID=1834516 RepID=A0A1V2IG52_9ACTN|nr:hypothetical protein [Pseudofrankia asymbiotica]ONH31431.1 hypothetical protein BL253_09325 [Pseudofrankia asymbiotica]
MYSAGRARPTTALTAFTLAVAALALASDFAVAGWLPAAHKLSRTTALLIVAVSTGTGLARIPLTLRWARALERPTSPGARWWRFGDLAVTAAALVVTALTVPVPVEPDGGAAPLVWFQDQRWVLVPLPAMWIVVTLLRRPLLGRAVFFRAPTWLAVGGITAVGFLFGSTILLLPLIAWSAIRLAVVAAWPAIPRRSRAPKARHPRGTSRPEATRPPNARPGTAGTRGSGAAGGRSPRAQGGRRPEEASRAASLSRLPALAEIDPDGAVKGLAVLLTRPVKPDAESTRSVLAAWVRRPDEAKFRRTWDLLLDACADLGASPRALLSAAGLRPRPDAAPGDGPPSRDDAATFRALAVRALVARQDGKDVAAVSSDRVFWELVDLVAPPGAPAGHAEWWCLLGDAATRHHRHDEAAARYREAARLGDPAARRALAHLLATQAKQHLQRGSRVSARRLLTEALKHENNPRYQLLRIAEEILYTERPGLRVLAELRDLASADASPGAQAEPGPVPAPAAGTRDLAASIAFWSALGQLRASGAVDAAAGDVALAGLRQATEANGADGHNPTLGIVAAALADDRPALVNRVRALHDEHGPAWWRWCSISTGYVLSTVATADPELFLALATDAPSDTVWAGETRAVAVHALLGIAVTQARDGRTAEALRILDLPALTGQPAG